MDEKKTINNGNPEAGEKTFTQEQVNAIVGERLAKEKGKAEAAFAERERQIAQRELLLNAKEKMNEMGLPIELLDALNMSSPEALEKALDIVQRIGFGLSKPTGEKIDIGPKYKKVPNFSNDSVREAFQPK